MFLNPFQEAFQGADADVVAFCAPRASGKTYSLLSYGFEHAQQTEAFHGLFMQDSSHQHSAMGDAVHHYGHYIKENIIKEGAYINSAQCKFSWLEQKSTLRIATPMQRTITQFQGSVFDYIGIDNLARISQSSFLSLMQRARSTTHGHPSVRVTFDVEPQGVINQSKDTWPYRFFAPWFDKEYDEPAPFGETRRFVTHGYDTIHWLKQGEHEPFSRTATVISPTYTYGKPLEYVDEVSEFTEEQFSYLLNRNRSKAKE